MEGRDAHAAERDRREQRPVGRRDADERDADGPQARPAGMSTGSERRSERWPKTGWITEEATVAASTSAEAAA